MRKSELHFVHWLQHRYPPDPARVPIGIGDDMAALRMAGDFVLVTGDMLMDGIDFQSEQHAPESIGRKALACSLSDCAAMAVKPVAATISLALPNSWSLEKAQQLYLGMEPLAGEFDVAIVGGDTNSWNHPLVIDVTVLAEPWPSALPVRRDTAKVGDRIYLSGRLGGSILGRHLTFDPRVELARLLRAEFRADLTAMIDISDGLSLDLHRLCTASGVGAELAAQDLLLHVSEDAHTLSHRDGISCIDHALCDGEDFELLFTLAPGAQPGKLNVPRHIAPHWTGVPVGRIVPRGQTLIDIEGRRRELEPRGWQHFHEE